MFKKQKYVFGICVWFLKKADLWNLACRDFGIIVRGRYETYLTRWALTIFKIITQLPLRTLVLLFKNRPEVISKLCVWKLVLEQCFPNNLCWKWMNKHVFLFLDTYVQCLNTERVCLIWMTKQPLSINASIAIKNYKLLQLIIINIIIYHL